MGFELLLPVVLFLLTLAIIFLLRSDDKRNQRAELIRKRSDALLKTVESSHIQFNESAQKIEERISKKIEESHLLMSHVDSQLTDLEARSEDLATLQRVLATYQTSLTQLESTTAQVEQRAALMRGEVANLVAVQESLSDFDLRFEQFKESLEEQIAGGEETLRLQNIRVRELLSSSFAKLQEYEKEVQQAEQDNLSQIANHTETLTSRQEASLALVSAQTAKLRLLSEEGEQQMLAYEKALQGAYRQANEKMQEQQRELSQLQNRYAEQQKRHEEELLAIEAKALLRLQQEMQDFVRQCHGEMGKIFDMTLSKTDVSFQNMIRVVSEYLKELSLRLEQAREVTKVLGASENASLLSFREELDTLLEETRKGEQNQQALQALEAEATSRLTLIRQQTEDLQASLATMKEERLALLKAYDAEQDSLSVAFAMALADEACKPLEEHPAVKQEDLPSVAYAMALAEEVEDEEGGSKKRPKHHKEKQYVVSDKDQQAASDKHQVEYLPESEEEVIILDEDDELTR